MPSPNRSFDLVVLDMDGTVLDRQFEGGISHEVRKAIAAVQAIGVSVTIATGRTLDYVRPYAALLKIRMPVVTAQGAVVGDPITGKTIHEQKMPLGMARLVAGWADETQRVTIFYFSNGDGSTSLYQNREVWSAEEYDHWLGTPRTLCPVLSDLFSTQDAHPPLKFITVNDPTLEPDMTETLQDLFGPKVHISRTHHLLVEGTAAGVDKGAGLQSLLDRLQIEPGRILVIGDNENDIPMFQLAGYSVAMGQASQKVKDAADWIAPPITEHGAAVAMSKLVLRT